MDEVLNRFENTTISPNESANNKTTNFDSLYKNWGKLGNQDERRKEILGIQKSNRNLHLDTCRGILELVQAVEEKSLFTNHRAYYKPSIYVAGFNKVPSYGKVLMMSEWMIEKPFDFDTNWVVVPSPKGTRVLVVASNGSTRLFTKYGHLLLECRTGLPGGNPCDPKSKVNCCVLDGFYQKKGDVLYVLDILAWNAQPMTNGELEFRDYWLRTQFSDLSGIKKISKKNELTFHLLPKESCESENFNQFMMKTHFDSDFAALDGLLFFHKKAHYFSGETPLVGWLFPYMVPEVLGSHITVNPIYMSLKPANYTNQADFIIDFNTKMEKKNAKGRGRKNSTRSDMDTEDITKTETKHNKSTPKSQNDMEPTTESMEAEAVLDSTDKAAPLVANLESKTEATNPEIAATMDADSPGTMDTKIPASMDAESTGPIDVETPASIDANNLGSVESESLSSNNLKTSPSIDAKTPTAMDAESLEKRDETKA